MRKCKKCRKKYPKEVLICPECGQDLKYPEGKKFAIVTLVFMLIPGILFSFEPMISLKSYMIIMLFICLAFGIISFVLAMIGHAKYPGNAFCTVLFWLKIAQLLSSVSLLIMILIFYLMLLDGCGLPG